MDIGDLNKFRVLLIENKKPVSKLEYTENNYSASGDLIEESLPTITTAFCETGLYNGEIYFVFIINAKTFNLELFNRLKNKSNVKMYGFVDFNKTLYPADKFNFDDFMKDIQKDKYLQIQFDYKNISVTDLFKEYFNLVDIFEKNKIIVVNQLEVNLSKRHP